MKVLHITGELGSFGSGPKYAAINLVKYLNRAGVEAVIYSICSNKKFLEEQKAIASYELQGIPVKSFPGVEILGKRNYQISVSFWRHLKTELTRFDIVHIHSVFLFGTFVSSRLCLLKNIPYVLRPHGSLMEDSLRLGRRWLKKAYIALIERKTIRQSAAVHFTTELEKDKTCRAGFGGIRSFVVPNGIDPEGLERPFPEIDYKGQNPNLAGKVLFLFLGRIAYEKGLDTLIDALSEVVKVRESVHLIIAGFDEDGYEKIVKANIVKKNLEKHVTFLGPVWGAEKRAILYGCDVFILPSYGTENFGIAAAEAMFCGLPVILTDYVGISGDVRKTGAGLVIKKDAVKLRDAMMHFVNHPDLRYEMGRNAAHLVKTEYAGERVARRLIQEYEKLLK